MSPTTACGMKACDMNTTDNNKHVSGPYKSETSSDTNTNKGTSSIEEAVAAVRRGEFVVVLDNEDRENEGDLIMPAEFATEESLAFMIRYCSGVICAPTTSDRLQRLQLPLMVSKNMESRRCKFTVSVDLIKNVSTGISAADRARTILAIADDASKPEDFNRPGHIFPLLAQDGGVISRAGHTEAAVDLARFAGCSPVGFLCEINDDNGRMMRRPELEVFALKHGLHMITISDMIRYRFTTETLVSPILNDKGEAVKECNTPTGAFNLSRYQSTINTQVIEALVYGNPSHQTNVIVYFMEKGLGMAVECQWAQHEITKNHTCGVIILTSSDEELINISGELMARQSVFGMGMQVLKSMQVDSVNILAKKKPEFDLSGFGMKIEGWTRL